MKCNDHYSRVVHLQVAGTGGEEVLDAKLSSGADFMAVACRDNPVSLTSLHKGEPVRLPVDSVVDMDFRLPRADTPTSEFVVATGSVNHQIRRFDLQLGIELSGFNMPRPSAVVYSHDGAMLAAGSEDGLVAVWNLSNEDRPLERVLSAAITDGSIRSLVFGAMNQRLFAVTSDGQLLQVCLNEDSSQAESRFGDVTASVLSGKCQCVSAHRMITMTAIAVGNGLVELTGKGGMFLGTIQSGVGNSIRKMQFLGWSRLLIVGDEGLEVWNLSPQQLVAGVSNADLKARVLAAREVGCALFVVSA